MTSSPSADAPFWLPFAWAASLAATMGLPSLFAYAGWASSHAVGVVAAALITLLGAWTTATPEPWALRRSCAARRWLQLATLTAMCLILHGLIAACWLPPVMGKPVASLVPVVLLVCSGAALAALAARQSGRHVDLTLAALFALLCVAWAFGFVRVQPAAAFVAYHKPMLPFTEPSHFALVFTPMALALCARHTGRTRLALQAVCGLIAIGIPNVTAGAGFVLVLLLTAPVRGLLVLALALAVGWSAILQTSLGLHYAERLDLSGANGNLSTLVYLQGWQLVAHAWTLSDGWGLGFQQLGLHGHVVPAGGRMIEQGLGLRNTQDGGFTAAKILAEFGWIGAVALVAYGVLFVRCAWQVRQHAAGRLPLNPGDLLSRACIAAFGIELFVRGAGYFTTGTLLFCMGAWMLAQRIEGTATSSASGVPSVRSP